MKKLYLLLSLLLVTLSVSAAPALKVKSGNWLSLLSEDSNVCVEFDYSNATWEEGESYEKFCGETYKARTEASVTDFISSFNTFSSGLKMANTLDGAKYKMIFRIKNLERKQGMSMWGRFFIRVYGEIEIVNIASNESICSILVNGHAGGDDFVPEDRLSKCFKSLAEKLIKLKK